MPRKLISIRLDLADLAWLNRDRTVSRSERLRRDLEELRRLRHIAVHQPHMPISEAVSIANLEAVKNS